MSWIRTTLALLVLATGVPLPAAGQAPDAVLLYDVDFGTPPHTLFSPTTVGSGFPPRPWSAVDIVDRPAIVAPPAAGFDQHARFVSQSRMLFRLHTIAEGFAETYPAYLLRTQVAVVDLAVPFTLHPGFSLHWVAFRPNGDIVAVQFETDPVTFELIEIERVLARWSAGERVAVEIEIEESDATGEWAVRLDGVEVFRRGFRESPGARAILLMLDEDPSGRSDVRVDDVRVWGSGPTFPGGYVPDADGDGESDVGDRCPDTEAGVPVDDAGCSMEQFCASVEVSKFGWHACLRADWRNDEPLRLSPRDCRPVGRDACRAADDRRRRRHRR